MSWAEIKKAINSNISKSLDVLITERSDEIINYLNSNEFGLSALKNSIKNESDLLDHPDNGFPGLKSDINNVIDNLRMSPILATEYAVSSFNNSAYITDYVQYQGNVKTLLANDTLFNIALNSSTAMNAIASSSTAMDLVAKNNDRMKYIASSDTALDAITSNSVAMNSICASESALKIIIGNEKSLKKIVSSGKAITAMASSSLARNIILSSDSALDALAKSPLVQKISETGNYSQTINGRGFVVYFRGISGYAKSGNSSTFRSCIGKCIIDIDGTRYGNYSEMGYHEVTQKSCSGENLFYYQRGITISLSENYVEGHSATPTITIKYVPGT